MMVSNNCMSVIGGRLVSGQFIKMSLNHKQNNQGRLNKNSNLIGLIRIQQTLSYQLFAHLQTNLFQYFLEQSTDYKQILSPTTKQQQPLSVNKTSNYFHYSQTLKMIDWQGLLKFSLQHSDGTKSSNFKQMSEEDKKWLEQAMKHYCNSEIERIKTILEQLSKPQKQSTEQARLSLLQQLQQILDSLDKGSTLFKMNGHIVLLKIIFFSKYESNKIVALQIFASVNQNDAYVQTESINSGALELVEVILKVDSIKLRENIMSTISAMLRGENLEAKRIFIRLNGFQLMKKLLNDQKVNSKRLKTKIFTLLRDLLFYDDRLHFTYNDLSSFSNTADIKPETLNPQQKQQKNTLYYDKNKAVINNELEENKKYKGCVKEWLKKEEEVQKEYKLWLQEQIKMESE